MFRPELGHASADTSVKLTRAAVYCRVSTDEGLHLEFNSLHAQREACEAYIKSQRQEGWLLVPAAYDDGGFSGGSLDRPALRQILADVAAGKIDTIVMYKIDRLTRSLPDFAKIVDVLDRAKASFVSVTQAFNTTTSMGRLTLNVLLSFAQFEREVGAERVRDKIAASKKRGMWMGGVCPLGYDAEDRKLVINQPEAEAVRDIFTLYLQLGSVILLEDELDKRSIRSKLRVRADGTIAGGRKFTGRALYALLQNRMYVGQTCHGGIAYPGQHSAIVEERVFEEAQQLIARNRVERRHQVTADEVSLLTGIVWSAGGRRLSPTHTKKGTARYRYYSARPGQGKAIRVAAADLEKVITARLSSFLGSRRELHDVAESWTLDGVTFEAVLFAGSNARETVASGTRHQVRELITKLLTRIEVHPERVSLWLRPSSLLELANMRVPPSVTAADISLVVPVRMFRRAREVRLAITPNAAADAPAKDAALIKLVTQAWAARRALFDGSGASLKQVAAAQGYEAAYFTVLVKLGFLSPKLIADILNGNQPAELTRQRLARFRDLPMDWESQARLIEGHRQ